MILLKHKYIEKDFIISENRHYSIIVENERFFYTLFKEFENNSENIIYSEDNKTCDLSKKILIIDNLFNLDYNTKKSLNILYKHIQERIITELLKDELQQIDSKIISLIEKIRLDLPFSCDYNDQIDISALLSLVSFKIIDTNQSFLENLVMYIKIYKEISSLRIIVVPFLSSFLSEEDILLFEKEMNYLNVTIIELITFNSNKSFSEKVIIDKDLCEI